MIWIFWHGLSFNNVKSRPPRHLSFLTSFQSWHYSYWCFSVKFRPPWHFLWLSWVTIRITIIVQGVNLLLPFLLAKTGFSLPLISLTLLIHTTLQGCRCTWIFRILFDVSSDVILPVFLSTIVVHSEVSIGILGKELGLWMCVSRGKDRRSKIGCEEGDGEGWWGKVPPFLTHRGVGRPYRDSAPLITNNFFYQKVDYIDLYYAVHPVWNKRQTLISPF